MQPVNNYLIGHLGSNKLQYVLVKLSGNTIYSTLIESSSVCTCVCACVSVDGVCNDILS